MSGQLSDFLFYEEPGIQLYCGDCREVLPLLRCPNTSYCLEACDGRCRHPIGLVVADPPYTFGLASTSMEGKAGGWGDMMNNAYWYAAWLMECKRILANRGGAWVFNSWRSFPVLARASHDASWPIESLMVWDKEWIGPGGQRGLRPSYELIALFVSGDFAIPNRGVPDILRVQYSSARANGHPAEKPEHLIGGLIAMAGDPPTILDPFCGSGTTLVAAKARGRAAIGIEIEPKYCEVTVKRLRQEVLPLKTGP